MGLSRETVLAAGRRAAEAGMTDTCTARRRTGTTYDDDTGTAVPTWTQVYSGPCKLTQPRASSATVTSANVGEAAVLLVQPEIHLPITAALLRPGDEITLTDSPSDPLSEGRVFAVRAMSGATARRYSVTERTS